MLPYLTVNTIIELTVFIISLFTLIKDNNLFWRLIVLYLFLVCVAEINGIHFRILYMQNPKANHTNEWVYNILTIPQIIILSLFFKEVLFKKNRISKFIIPIIILLGIIYTYELFTHGIFVYNKNTVAIRSVIMVIFCFIYYYFLIKNDTYINLSFSPEFWWVTGCFFFFFGSTICNLAYPSLAKIRYSNGTTISYYIFQVLNILLYSCWSYAFFCRKWESTKQKT